MENTSHFVKTRDGTWGHFCMFGLYVPFDASLRIKNVACVKKLLSFKCWLSDDFLIYEYIKRNLSKFGLFVHIFLFFDLVLSKSCFNDRDQCVLWILGDSIENNAKI